MDRFHLPMLVYSGVVLALVAAVSVWASRQSLRLQQANWEARAQSAAVTFASTLEIGEDGQPGPGPVATRLARMAATDDAISGVSLLHVTDEPGRLKVLGEWTTAGGGHAEGSIIDVAQRPDVTAGLRQPVVSPGPQSFAAWAPVRDIDGRRVAVLGIQVDAPELEVQRTRLMQGTVLVIGLCALGLVLVTFITARREEFAAERRARAPPPAREPAPPPDVLGRRFEIMARGLHEREFIKETFGRYLSHRVAEVLLAEQGAMFMPGEAREVTVLHAVLVHFGEVVANTPPTDVVAVLNEFHGQMAGLVDSHGGTILEFHGAGILAVFGAPVGLVDHSERAVRCAIKMRERLLVMNREWEKSGRARTWQAAGLRSIRLGMGIHKSRVIAGNAGSSSRMKYNVVGEAVDVAGAIEHLAMDFGTDILISEEVLRAIPDGVITATEKGSQKVEGRSDVRIYSV